MYVYARINKETIKFIRETKAITLDYVSRITKYSSSKIELWENSDTDKFPTINQAKSIAKCYRVPFAGLYRIVTCSEIIEEVNDDALKQWYIGLSGEILPIDDEVQENVKKVVTTNPQLIDFHKVKSSGDAFLIATAMKYGLTVITEESKKGEKKIPFVCQNLHVPCVDILGLCEKEEWSF